MLLPQSWHIFIAAFGLMKAEQGHVGPHSPRKPGRRDFRPGNPATRGANGGGDEPSNAERFCQAMDLDTETTMAPTQMEAEPARAPSSDEESTDDLEKLEKVMNEMPEALIALRAFLFGVVLFQLGGRQNANGDR